MFLILGCPYCEVEGGHAEDCEFITALRDAGLIEANHADEHRKPISHEDCWTPPWRRDNQ